MLLLECQGRVAANWCVAEWRRLGKIYGNAGLAARITQNLKKHGRTY